MYKQVRDMPSFTYMALGPSYLPFCLLASRTATAFNARALRCFVVILADAFLPPMEPHALNCCNAALDNLAIARSLPDVDIDYNTPLVKYFAKVVDRGLDAIYSVSHGNSTQRGNRDGT